MQLSQEIAYALIFKEYPDVVTVTQMSQMLGVCEKTSYRLLRTNTIVHFKIGTNYKIPKLHIFDYLNVVDKTVLEA